MGSIETAVKYSKRFESLLEKQYGATGKGLHEKLSSVEGKLPQDIIKTLRWVATIRNNAVHEDGFEIQNLDDFIKTCERVLAQLNSSNTSQTISKQNPVYFPKVMVNYFIFFFVIVLIFRACSNGTKSEDEFNEKTVNVNEVTHSNTTIETTLKEGELYAMAQKSSSNYEQAKIDIDNNIWGYIQKNTSITLGKPQVRDRGDGTYDLLVSVEWVMSPKPILSTLNKYFWDYSKEPLSGKANFDDHMGEEASGVAIKKHDNENELLKEPYSFDLYKYLVSKQAKIVVFAGKHEGKVTIATGRQCFVSCEGVGDDQYQIHFTNQFKKELLIFNPYQGEQNPIVIKGISAAELKNIHSLKAEVKIEK